MHQRGSLNVENETRAQELARRELLREPRSYAVEIRECGKVHCKETVRPAGPTMA